MKEEEWIFTDGIFRGVSDGKARHGDKEPEAWKLRPY